MSSFAPATLWKTLHRNPIRLARAPLSRFCSTKEPTGDTSTLPSGETAADDKARLGSTSQSSLDSKRRERASEQLRQLFVDDSVRASMNQRSSNGKPLFGARRIDLTPEPKSAPSAIAQKALWDEDEPSGNLSTTSPPSEIIETIEQELLDDNFVFFPESQVSQHDKISPHERTSTQDIPRYIPGQQIVPPGFTRYRVDVQYQGMDFDGWFKSSARQHIRTERLPDGTLRRNAVSIHSTAASSEMSKDGAMGTRYHAQTVLEEALAVAVDLPSVHVVAAAIPETGVSVRRLCCHVDLPSTVEMQARTIIQRATMWLQQRNQPLAVLSCHRCRNQDFHARHSAARRVYCYRLLNRVAPPLFDAGLQWHVDRHLDVDRMRRFAAVLQGTHDFGYFADPKMLHALRRAASPPSASSRYSAAFSEEHYAPTSGVQPTAPKVEYEKGLSELERAAALPTFNEFGQKVVHFQAKPKEYFKARTNLPTIRTIDKIDIVRQDDEVILWFVGKSFLRHQIRHMVSVLKASGHGLWDELELQHALQSGFEVSRKKFERERLPAAPVHGLTLWDVEYPAEHMHDAVSFVDSGPYEEMDISTIN